MLILTDLTSFSNQFDHVKTAICIGNFDGLHLGHQAIIRHMTEQARRSHLQSVVLTFQSNTRRWKGSVCLLSSFDEKVSALRSWGVDILMALPFPGYIAALPPHTFVIQVLLRRLGMQTCYVGENFRFGKDRKGTVSFLASCAKRLGFHLQVFDMLSVEGQWVSSTAIRSLVHQGEVHQVNRFLGHPYEIEGLVVKGYGRGKSIGYPTSNLLMLDSLKCIPAEGIYVSTSHWDQQSCLSVTHIGPQPTFSGMRPSIETHLIGQSPMLYQRNLRIRFLQRLRDIYSFNSTEALSAQIAQDIEKARELYPGL